MIDWSRFVLDMIAMIMLAVLVGIFIVIPITITISCIEQIFIEN